jgi:predicted  nucleic acid-binding Zn-ribbon protein
VILAEINRQREATERVMSEAFRLARSYDDLQKVIKEMGNIATNHLTLNARLATAERRVVEFEKELQRLNAPLAPTTNEIPSSIVAEPDKSEP